MSYYWEATKTGDAPIDLTEYGLTDDVLPGDDDSTPLTITIGQNAKADQTANITLEVWPFNDLNGDPYCTRTAKVTVKPCKCEITQFEDGIGLPGSQVSLARKIKNTSECKWNYFWKATKKEGDAPITIPNPSGTITSLAPNAENAGQLTVTIGEAATGGQNATIELAVWCGNDDTGNPCHTKIATITVLKLEIIEPNENPVTDNNFVFNSAYPGICNVTAYGTCGVTNENPNLEWELTAISGSNQTSNPSPPKGAIITFTYSILPAINDFGNKTLTLKHPDLKDECKDTQSVEIFFPRDAYNHSGVGSGTTPNWYYYWKTDSVVSDLTYFDYQNVPGYGAYYPSTGQLVVRNAAPTSDNYQVTFTNLYYMTSLTSGPNGIANTSAIEDDVQVIPVGQGEPNQTAITAGWNGILNTTPSGDDAIVGSTITTGANGKCNTTASGDDVQVIPLNQGKPNSMIITAGPDTFLHTPPSNDDQLDLSNAQTVFHNINFSGIDCCAETCTHELKHKQLFDMVGGPPNPNPTNDWDYVDDNYELNSPYHLDPGRKDTYDCAGTIGYGDDNEFLARMAEQNPGQRDPGKDWSDTNGKQWSN